MDRHVQHKKTGVGKTCAKERNKVIHVLTILRKIFESTIVSSIAITRKDAIFALILVKIEWVTLRE